MRSWLSLLLIFTGMFLAIPGLDAQAEAQERVTLSRKDVTLREALDLIFADSVFQYSMDPNVPDVRVTVNVRDLFVSMALGMVVRQAALEVPGLTLHRDGDVYVIRVPPPQAGQAVSWTERRVSLALEKTPLREGLAELLGGSGVKPRVGRGIPDVPLSLDVRGVPLRSAMYQIVRQVAAEVSNLRFVRAGDEWRLDVIHAQPPAPAAGERRRQHLVGCWKSLQRQVRASRPRSVESTGGGWDARAPRNGRRAS
jgi:hypothetical protein